MKQIKSHALQRRRQKKIIKLILTFLGHFVDVQSRTMTVLFLLLILIPSSQHRHLKSVNELIEVSCQYKLTNEQKNTR